MSEFDIKAKEEINQLASCRRKMSFNAEYTYKVAALAGIALARAGPKSGKKTLEVTAGIDTVDDAANSRVSRGILKSQLDSVDRGIHRAIPAAPPVVRTAERDISPVMLPSASLGVKLRLMYLYAAKEAVELGPSRASVMALPPNSLRITPSL